MYTSTININQCLSFNELKLYIENKLSKEKQQTAFNHICSCALCSNAVNGFANQEISFKEVEFINSFIDTKINNEKWAYKTFVYSTIVLLSFLSIGLFYFFANNTHQIESTNQISQVKRYKKNNDKLAPVTEHTIYSIPLVNDVEEESKNKNELIPEPVKKIKPNLLSINPSENTLSSSKLHSDDIYIYDLKVTQFEQLYTTKTGKEIIPFRNTPSYIENKESQADYYQDEINSVKVDYILKKGLLAFKNNKYEDALPDFNLLLSYNNNDVNASFYAALCYYNLNKNSNAISLLTPLTKTNNSFYEEAKWNLALCYEQNNENEKAKNLFREIISEKGFYEEKAKKKIK